MPTFLHDVAEYILKHYDTCLRNCCVVFPNQRSSVYFCDAIKQVNKKVIWLPRIFTIDELISKIANQKVASPIKQLATLYDVHQEVTHSGETFDRFFPWAQTILSDFNDIDKYLVDAQVLLRNIQEIKQLDSSIDYLTEQQRDAIERFFNVVYDGSSDLKKRFLDIWHNLLPMYELFGKKLNQKGFAYDGQVYRKAVENITSDGYEFPFDKVFFVGFNAITKCEERVFKVLKAQQRAVFFWDYDQSYIDDKYQEAGLFLRRFVTEFAAPDDFVTSHDFGISKKEIAVVASPTVSGQMTVVAEQLANIPQTEITDTALVLADESILMNVVENVSPYVSDINITMGYKIKNSIAGHWIEQLIQLQLNKRQSADTATFYYKDVLALLQHPFFISASPDFAAGFAETIRKEALFQVPVARITDDEFARMVFNPVNEPHEFSNYALSILKCLMNVWGQEQTDSSEMKLVHQELVYRLILQIQQLDTELADEQIAVEMPTYYKLLRNYIGSLNVPFSGEPIKGLQVMGFLETRNLDFRNLIILNVNEGTLPTDGSSPTFVPFSMRRAFGLPTHEEREAMYAYYFYRLIQRAQNVTLTYFVGKNDGRSGEPSRYIMQLMYGGGNVNHRVLRSDIVLSAGQPMIITKNGYTMQQLSAFIVDDRPFDKVSGISPSDIVTYQRCQVEFYFSKVLNLRPDDDVEENIDLRRFGNIFHNAMQKIYIGFVGKTITAADIHAMPPEFVEAKIAEAFAEEMFPFDEARQKSIADGRRKLADELNGNNLIVHNVIKKYVEAQMRYDEQTAEKEPISFIGLEKKCFMRFPIEINGKKTEIKLKGVIDRIDKLADELRIIDYKTGSNDVVCNSVDDVFDALQIKKNKGILQTLIYCMMFDSEDPTHQTMMPYLFKTVDLSKNADFKVRSKNDEFSEGSYRRVETKVKDFVAGILSDIFDKEKPFVQTADEKKCEHCNFFYFCNKQSKSNDY